MQLCGHRLHVNQSFKLYLTTTTPLSSLKPGFHDDLALISLDVTQPIATDLLLNIALEKVGGDEFRENVAKACVGVASCKTKLVELDCTLFGQLPVEGAEPVYRVATERIATTVETKNQV